MMLLPVLSGMRTARFTRRNSRMKPSIGKYPMMSGWPRSVGTQKLIGDVPASSLDECDAALSHATPSSCLFYLPAYMKRALELLAANDRNSDLPNSVTFHLTLDRGSSGPSFYVFERFRQITPAQERAIVAFLEYVKGYSTADRWHPKCAKEALDSFWVMPPQQ
jgi:hypothetical protein